MSNTANRLALPAAAVRAACNSCLCRQSNNSFLLLPLVSRVTAMHIKRQNHTEEEQRTHERNTATAAETERKRYKFDYTSVVTDEVGLLHKKMDELSADLDFH